MESEEQREQAQDPGTSETPTGVPPAGEEPAQNEEIDEQPQGSEDADVGEPHGGGATDAEDADDEAPDSSGTSV